MEHQSEHPVGIIDLGNEERVTVPALHRRPCSKVHRSQQRDVLSHGAPDLKQNTKQLTNSTESTVGRLTQIVTQYEAFAQNGLTWGGIHQGLLQRPETSEQWPGTAEEGQSYDQFI